VSNRSAADKDQVMKGIIPLCFALATTSALAGTLTIIPDSTSTMGIQKQQRDAQVRAQAERQARVAAGVEQPPVIIVRPAPQQRRNTHMDCYSYGPNKQYLSCD
jgi:hypothetical protein